MNITVYLTDSKISHTDAERIYETNNFVCIIEGKTLYRYSLNHIIMIVEDGTIKEKEGL